MIALEREKNLRGHGIPWISCKPFVENSNGVLIHRPRKVTTWKISERWKAHISVMGWCGATATGAKRFTFLDAPEADRIVCAKCEEKAVEAGLLPSSQLAGRHVHTGGVVAVKYCCAAIAKAEGETK
jgi:hypothetical protein